MDHKDTNQNWIAQQGITYLQTLKFIASRDLLVFVFVILMVVTLSACQLVQKTPEPTPNIKITQFQQTITARVQNIEATQRVAQTLQAQATQLAQAAKATQNSNVAAEDSSRNATATAAAPVLAELPFYGVDPSTGYVAWIHKPVTLTVDAYKTGDYANDYGTLTVKDFVMAADITWDTEYGVSGCGFTLRSNGDMDAANQYMVVLSRSANGHVYFSATADGKVANFRNFYANLIDPVFKWENGATNRLAVVAKGNNIQIYTNQKLVGEVDITDPPPQMPDLPEHPVKPEPPSSDLKGNELQEAKHAFKQAMDDYRDDLKKYDEKVSKVKAEHAAILKTYASQKSVYEEGFVGMLVYSYSGYVNCQFNNAWLWVIK